MPVSFTLVSEKDLGQQQDQGEAVKASSRGVRGHFKDSLDRIGGYSHAVTMFPIGAHAVPSVDREYFRAVGEALAQEGSVFDREVQESVGSLSVMDPEDIAPEFEEFEGLNVVFREVVPLPLLIEEGSSDLPQS